MVKSVQEMIDDAIKHGAIRVPDEVKEERLSICSSCSYYDPEQERCKECGCWLQLKTSFAASECPIDKWGKTVSG